MNDCLLNTNISYFVTVNDATVFGNTAILFVHMENYNYYLFIVQFANNLKISTTEDLSSSF